MTELVLAGEDAKKFLEYNNRELTDKEKEKLKEAYEFYKKTVKE